MNETPGEYQDFQECILLSCTFEDLARHFTVYVDSVWTRDGAFRQPNEGPNIIEFKFYFCRQVLIEFTDRHTQFFTTANWSQAEFSHFESSTLYDGETRAIFAWEDGSTITIFCQSFEYKPREMTPELHKMYRTTFPDEENP